MSRAARKVLINKLSGHGVNPDLKLREHLLGLIDSKVDLQCAAKAFYAPKKKAKKKVAKKKVAKKRRRRG